MSQKRYCKRCSEEFIVTCNNKKFCSDYCRNNIKYQTRKNDPGRKEQVRAYNLKQSFGITVEEYNTLFQKQDGKCAICKIHQKELNKRLAVDHCHITDTIRGLLCTNCNTGIGNLRDSIELLEAAIKYLKDS